jgi:hypothetical protein
MDPNQELAVTARIFQLPYAEKLKIVLKDAQGSKPYTTNVTLGKAMHIEPFGCAEMVFTSDGRNPVTIDFKDVDGNNGVWLNAFALSHWISSEP